MLNTDDIPEKDVMGNLNMNDSQFVRAVLTDQPNGCLSGVRF